jgi:hypothetical protein
MNFNAPTMMGGPSMPTPPNSGIKDGDKNGSFPQPHVSGNMNPPNMGLGGDKRNGSFPLSESGSPINPPNAMGARVNGGPGRG